MRLITKLNSCFCRVFEAVSIVNNIGSFERKEELLGSVNPLIIYSTTIS